MTKAHWLAGAAIVALATGCSTQKGGDQGTDIGAQPGGDTSPPGIGNPPPPPPSCSLGAPGTVFARIPITGGAIVATDRAGNVFYTADRGFVKLDTAGNRVFTFAF